MIQTDLGFDMNGRPRGWLDAPAAASLRRVDFDLGRPLQVTSAGRTRAEQTEARHKWETGQGAFAALPGTSPHEFGNAIDTNDRFTWLLAQHGWSRPLAFEPWHFVYYPQNDQHINRPEEDDMPITPEDAHAIAQAVWRFKMNGGAKNGNEVPAETAGERLRNIRRSTHGAKATLTAIRSGVEALALKLAPALESVLGRIEVSRAADADAEDAPDPQVLEE